MSWNSQNPKGSAGPRSILNSSRTCHYHSTEEAMFRRIVDASKRTGRAPFGVPVKHPDSPQICDYVLQHILTAEFLFLSTQPERWNPKTFLVWAARTVMERGEIPVNVNMMNLVSWAEFGHTIQLPSKSFIFSDDPDWSFGEKEIIERAASKYWIEWRKDAELDFGTKKS
ncbi:hypothetical protein BT63DRAFT_442527 [Microthyrium microscopicum]|uniref:Uncharacterized protein n=1 Tax=Microthyrium microscopicum TaxID=703497 RepID=A0A6A6U2W9_9PEZI|nr:hypothetical protein BT63DRAFT_442527 [Microthyrium microscopicum]